MGLVMAWAGAGGTSADRISLLRDADRDGLAEPRPVFLDGLHSRFGMALIGQAPHVANTDAVMAFPYVTDATRITSPGVRIAIDRTGALLLADDLGNKVWRVVPDRAPP